MENAAAAAEERQTVSELVRNFGDSLGEGPGKRDRSESGDPAPAGKRGARERDSEPSPSPRNTSMRQYLDDALEKLEERLSSSISRDLHEFRELVSSELSALTDRVRDLERHVEERDLEVAELTNHLDASRKQIKLLEERAENAEMNSRIPCLVLSGQAMAPHRPTRLDAPLPPAGRTAPGGGDSARGEGRAESADAPAGAGRARDGERGGRSAGGQSGGEAEDINQLVISAVRSRLPGLDITDADIDRAHRLPGANHKVIVRFVRSGPGGVRDQLMSRRLELKGRNDLFINESLTAQKSQIFRSLLEAKKNKKIYTVYTRWGHVYYKAEKFGTSSRVESVDKLRELRFPVKQ
ncbi:hypothetical protein FJT64_006732 [Amphibalanus amphitrite]|uniref:Uncharacterized protein n=1 Tax=Amphibalanus amphitrite TaxID=1232801 RepID=A0A6A4W1S1_AMPAM|nr:hypothetical protein FJT64_006732 [Amphibalanus amphitrite]